MEDIRLLLVQATDINKPLNPMAATSRCVQTPIYASQRRTVLSNGLQPPAQQYGGYHPPPQVQYGGRPGLPSVSSNSYVHGNHSAPPPPPAAPQHFGPGAPQGYAFRYSQCTGRRKALLIGINYFNQRGQLRGCINDVRNMSAYLVENFGYKREDMVILTDDQQNPMSQPTKQNILRAMHWLVKDAQPNDSLFFHYSGKSFPMSLTDADSVC